MKELTAPSLELVASSLHANGHGVQRQARSILPRCLLAVHSLV
jgi:hypothetical protein